VASDAAAHLLIGFFLLFSATSVVNAVYPRQSKENIPDVL
jgi:hypothetical protein